MPAVIGGLVVLAVVGIAAFVLLNRPPTPPAVPVAPAARSLTAAELATLVAGARAYSHGKDPAEEGLDPDRTVAWRALAADIEAGRVGMHWPTFRADLELAAVNMAKDEDLAARRGNDRAKSDIASLRRRFDSMVTALHSGDLAASRSAFSQLQAARVDFVDPSK